MAGFTLPHDHGEQKHAENLHRELMNVEHFGAVCEIFKRTFAMIRAGISKFYIY